MDWFDADIPVYEENSLHNLHNVITKFASKVNTADVGSAHGLAPRRGTGPWAEGGYAKVYRYWREDENELVAVKRFRVGPRDAGLPAEAVRELSILQEVRAACKERESELAGRAGIAAVQSRAPAFIQGFCMKGRLHAALEAADTDLAGLLERVHGWVRAGWEGGASPPQSVRWPGSGQGHHGQQGTPIWAVQDVAALTVSLCATLGTAHQEGWLHRDVKPSNILLRAPRLSGREGRAGEETDNGPTVMLCDWGTSGLLPTHASSNVHVESSAAGAVQQAIHAATHALGTPQRLGMSAALDEREGASEEDASSEWTSPSEQSKNDRGRWHGGMTCLVTTMSYRAPEILFALPAHGTAVDMWAVGCTIAELLRAAVHVQILNASSDLGLSSASRATAGSGSGHAADLLLEAERKATQRAGHPCLVWTALAGGASTPAAAASAGRGAAALPGSTSRAQAAVPAPYPAQILPLFDGRGELLLLASHTKLLGPCDAVVWPEALRAPGYMCAKDVCSHCEFRRSQAPDSGAAASTFSTPPVTKLYAGGKAPQPAPFPAWVRPETVARSCIGSTAAYHADAITRMSDALGLTELSGLGTATGVAGREEEESTMQRAGYLLDAVLHCLAYDPAKRAGADLLASSPGLREVIGTPLAGGEAWGAGRMAQLCLGLPSAPQRAAADHRPGQRVYSPVGHGFHHFDSSISADGTSAGAGSSGMNLGLGSVHDRDRDGGHRRGRGRAVARRDIFNWDILQSDDEAEGEEAGQQHGGPSS